MTVCWYVDMIQAGGGMGGMPNFGMGGMPGMGGMGGMGGGMPGMGGLGGMGGGMPGGGKARQQGPTKSAVIPLTSKNWPFQGKVTSHTCRVHSMYIYMMLMLKLMCGCDHSVECILNCIYGLYV